MRRPSLRPLASPALALTAALCACLAAACFSSSSSSPLAPEFDAGFDGGFGEPDASVESGADDVTVAVDSSAIEAAVEASVEATALDAGVDAVVEASADATADAAAPVEAGLLGAVSGGTAYSWPEGLAVVGSTLYWLDSSSPSLNQGSMQSCDISQGTCTPQVLSGLTGLPPNTQLASDGSYLFMPLGGASIYSAVHMEACPVGTCSSTTISFTVDGLGGIGLWDEITGVAVDGANLYYAGGVPGSTYGLYVASKSGTPAPYGLVTGLPHTANVAVDANNVYFGESSGGIYTCSLAADAGPCGPTLLQATTGTSGLAVDATSLYWGDPVAGAVYRCPLAGCGATSPTVLASNQGHVNSLALAGSYILYSVGTSADAGAAIGVFGALR